MITIIHGDDLVSSRKFLVEQKNSLQNTTTLNGDELTLEKLVEAFEGSSLFSDEKNIFIENLFSKKRSKELEEILDYISKKNDIDLFIWEKTDLSKSQLSTFPKAKTFLFKIPKNIFSFLDNISPKNNNNILNFHKVLETNDPDIIFYMLIRQFRLLLAVSGTSSNSIDEMQRLSPWQRNNLERQSKKFSLSELRDAYNKLYKLDLNIKTGVSSNLTTAIDFLLLDI